MWVCLPAVLSGKSCALRPFCPLPWCWEITELALSACLGSVYADLTPQSQEHPRRAFLSQCSMALGGQCGDTQMRPHAALEQGRREWPLSQKSSFPSASVLSS